MFKFMLCVTCILEVQWRCHVHFIRHKVFAKYSKCSFVYIRVYLFAVSFLVVAGTLQHILMC